MFDTKNSSFLPAHEPEPCVICSRMIVLGKGVVDWEGWTIHPECMSSINVSIVQEDMTHVELKGVESMQRAYQELDENYPTAISVVIYDTRKTTMRL